MPTFYGDDRWKRLARHILRHGLNFEDAIRDDSTQVRRQNAQFFHVFQNAYFLIDAHQTLKN